VKEQFNKVGKLEAFAAAPTEDEEKEQYRLMRGMFGKDAGVGFDCYVSIVLPPSPGIVAAPSNATISAPPSGTARCNNAGVPMGMEVLLASP
jgi:hypothetical protein